MPDKDAIPVKVEVSPPKDWAAGVPAVMSAYRNVSNKVGPIKGSKLLTQVNQFSGFDCPGCAWPDPLDKRATFEFCENGAKAIADEATLARVGPDFFARFSVPELREQSDRWLNAQGRLTHPMLLEENSDHYRAVSWSQAFDVIAETLNSLDSPDHAAFYTSGRTSNEAAYLYQLFVRKFGTNNLPDCSNLCHESSGVGLSETIGVGKGTVTLDDLENTDVIYVFGQNPGSNHPRMLTSLQKAKRNGARIVTVNPLDETGLKRFKNPQEVSGVIGDGTALRDLHVPVKINGDVALLKGMCKCLLDADASGVRALDHAFIEEYCHGFEAFRQDILDADWPTLCQSSGLSQAQIQQAADYTLTSQKTICCWAMGMTQHKNAVANVQMMTNFLMLHGNIGKPGAGVCPVRGHSNVQGDRTMGIWEKPTEALLDTLEQRYQFAVPRHHGVDTVDAIHGMHQRHIKALIALGGNFFRAAPDHEYTSAALSRCELTVQISTKLNRSHLMTGRRALILPVLGRTEVDKQRGGVQTVTVENSMGVVQTSHGKIPPAHEQLKSEVAVIAEMAHRTLGDEPVNWLSLRDDYARIRDEIAAVVPGFEAFNQRLDTQDEFVLPNAARDARQFNTPTGKANFIVQSLTPHRLAEGQLMMMTIRSHDQFNTTVYTNEDRYRGIAGSRRVIFVNSQDLEALGMSTGDWADVTSHWQFGEGSTRTLRNFQVVAYDIPVGCAAGYYPETNDLILIDSVADKSNTPAYKSVIISLQRSGNPPE